MRLNIAFLAVVLVIHPLLGDSISMTAKTLPTHTEPLTATPIETATSSVHKNRGTPSSSASRSKPLLSYTFNCSLTLSKQITFSPEGFSASRTVTQTANRTQSKTLIGTDTVHQSRTHTHFTITKSHTASMSTSLTTSSSRSYSSRSLSRTQTRSRSIMRDSHSNSLSVTKTRETFTHTVTPPPTPSRSPTKTNSTVLTASTAVTTTPTRRDSLSMSMNASPSHSQRASGTGTLLGSLTLSKTPPPTPSPTKSSTLPLLPVAQLPPMSHWGSPLIITVSAAGFIVVALITFACLQLRSRFVRTSRRRRAETSADYLDLLQEGNRRLSEV